MEALSAVLEEFVYIHSLLKDDMETAEQEINRIRSLAYEYYAPISKDKPVYMQIPSLIMVLTNIDNSIDGAAALALMGIDSVAELGLADKYAVKVGTAIKKSWSLESIKERKIVVDIKKVMLIFKEHSVGVILDQLDKSDIECDKLQKLHDESR